MSRALAKLRHPRIGRQVDHFKEVDILGITACFSKDTTKRFGLYLPYKKNISDTSRTKRAAIVLKNPSSADATKADKTIRTAAKVIYETFSDISSLEVLNLFSYRATETKDLQNTFDACHNKTTIGMLGHCCENTAHFKRILTAIDYCICAWGGPSNINRDLYIEAINAFWNLCIPATSNQPEFYRKSEKGSRLYPFHACCWPYNDDFTPIYISTKVNISPLK